MDPGFDVMAMPSCAITRSSPESYRAITRPPSAIPTSVIWPARTPSCVVFEVDDAADTWVIVGAPLDHRVELHRAVIVCAAFSDG